MKQADQVVVLVHGLGSNRLVMWVLAQRLARRGYRVVNWGYSSIRGTLQSHGKDLHRKLRALEEDESVRQIHLVAHSMGGIVSRTALTLGRFSKLGRMVMLCPPNRGSHVATIFGPWLRPVCQVVDQLAARPDSFVNTLPIPQDLEVGIIAASYDALVRLESTYLGTERDHLVWPYTLHTGVLFRTGVADQIFNFLEHGTFLRSDVAISA